MAFFKKLKDRLFKSSSKLDAGLEAIVDEASDPVADVQASFPVIDPPSGDPVDVDQSVADLPPVPAPVPVLVSDENVEASSGAAEGLTKGFLGRIFGRSDKAAQPKRRLDDDMLEQLEELLISADMGVDTAMRVTANMAEGRFGTSLSVAEIKALLAQEIARIMEPVAKPLPLYAKKPQVVLVVGVNGSGKTTTIGKLASQFKAAGKSVVIAAGDTFRAAAVEQ